MFYIDILREQDELMGNTGFDPDMVVNSDDKYAIDLKDIAQAVEDINDEYAEESEQEELDGQDLCEDPVAEAMIAIYENEYNWNLVMEAVGTSELLEHARGRELVMEAADVKGFIEKAKEFFVNMFRKITDTVTAFLQKHSAAARISASFAKKYGKDIKAGQAAYAELVSKGKRKALEGYDFTKMDSIVDNLKGEIKKLDSEVSNFSYQDAQKYAEAKDLNPNLVIGEFTDGKASNMKELGNAITKELFGEKGTLSGEAASGERAIKILETGVSEMHAIKNIYTEVKRNFNNTIKSLNKMKDYIPKAEKQGDAMKGLNNVIKTAKVTKNAVHVVYSCIMKAMRARQMQALTIARTYAHAAGALKKVNEKEAKKDKKQDVKESAGFFGALELL